MERWLAGGLDLGGREDAGRKKKKDGDEGGSFRGGQRQRKTDGRAARHSWEK